MATRTTETINGVVWIVYDIDNGETINSIQSQHGQEDWMILFPPNEELYDMILKYEPISTNFTINGTINSN